MYRTLLAALLLAASSGAFADDITDLDALTQNNFEDLSTDIGAVLTFKQVSSAESEGVLDFDLGLDVSGTQVAHDSAWKTATDGSDVNTIGFARLRARKGLPGGFDIGAFYATAPDSNIKAYGAELRYALVEGGAATPAVGLRGTYSRLTGVDQLDLHTSSLALSISKGFGPLTPFAGVGRVWTSSDPATSTGLDSAHPAETEVFAGLNIGFTIMDLTVAADRVGENTTYSVKLAVGF